ncbi:MAG: 2-oxo-4-hydroxy-4-carboxy-5-ureidoimidazoline decarboxylase [Alphaproteobacteria bacterium]
MKLEELNALDAAAFEDAFGDIAEESPWVAVEASRAGPFASRAALVEAFANALMGADDEDKLAVICAHPDLAGKLAAAGRLTEDSTAEQASAGLDQLTDAEREEFTALNESYKARFGFPFILAVKGATKAQILSSFRERLPKNRQTEFEEALKQVCRIMTFRLEERISESAEND